MANETVLNQISQQQTGDDPFSIARQKAQAQGQVLDTQATPQTAPTQTLQNSLPQSSSQPQTMNQALMKQVASLGVDPSNIQMSNTGKLLLRSRLQQQFGAQYEADPNVKDLLNKWDTAANFYSDQVAKNDATTKANGERTLAALKALG
jgi:hypothetical protein